MKVCLRHDFKPHISYGFYCSIIMPRASFFERCCAPRSTNIIHYSFFSSLRSPSNFSLLISNSPQRSIEVQPCFFPVLILAVQALSSAFLMNS